MEDLRIISERPLIFAIGRTIFSIDEQHIDYEIGAKINWYSGCLTKKITEIVPMTKTFSELYADKKWVKRNQKYINGLAQIDKQFIEYVNNDVEPLIPNFGLIKLEDIDFGLTYIDTNYYLYDGIKLSDFNEATNAYNVFLLTIIQYCKDEVIDLEYLKSCDGDLYILGKIYENKILKRDGHELINNDYLMGLMDGLGLRAFRDRRNNHIFKSIRKILTKYNKAYTIDKESSNEWIQIDINIPKTLEISYE